MPWGPGIDEEHLAHVDRFFEADRSRSTGGSGLGLSIALANAKLQDSSLSAHNLERGNACFELTLPAAKADDYADPGPTDGSQSSGPVTSS